MMHNLLTRELIAKVIGSQTTIRINPKRCLGYSMIIDSSEYSIYERPLKADKIVAAYGYTVVKLRKGNCLTYYPDARVPFLNYQIKLKEDTFPGLYSNSKVAQCLLLPYLRTTKQDTHIRDLRLCVFTDKGQIFHNKPSRNQNVEGECLPNDIVRFEESVVWDIPGRKHPTLNEIPDESECYYPGLPDYCYVYSPKINSDPSFCDVYGNGGFGKSKTICENGEEYVCARFYKHTRTERENPFLFIGTGVRNDKVTLIGTYRSNVNSGVRICLFASSNGGREWFCKYEFSDFGEYAFQQGYSEEWGTNFGNRIALHAKEAFDFKDVKVYKRNLVLPTMEDGCVKTSFSWELKATVSDIRGDDSTTVYTKEPHELKTGNIIALQSTCNLPKEYDWLKCSELTEQGTINGFQFKVRVIDEVSFEILELTSSYVPTLPCRHIHHINPLKDGWIVGTGEIYPNGWLLYIQQNKADTFSVVSASEQFVMARINTKKESVQRTMGMIVKDTFEKKVIFASDHDTLERMPINNKGLHEISRGTTGVYVGHLDNIDDRNQFDCVLEAHEPCYFFQQLGEMMVFAGQRGELAICMDPDFKRWHQEHVGRFIMHYMGQYNNCHCFNDYIILRK